MPGGIAHLAQLTRIIVKSAVTGTLPSLSRLPRLHWVTANFSPDSANDIDRMLANATSIAGLSLRSWGCIDGRDEGRVLLPAATTLATLANLRKLQISYDAEAGEWPGEMAKLPRLKGLCLYIFNGALPEILFSLTSLQFLHIDSDVGTRLPEQVTSLQQLTRDLPASNNGGVWHNHAAAATGTRLWRSGLGDQA
jgi:hypothetical protein